MPPPATASIPRTRTVAGLLARCAAALLGGPAAPSHEPALTQARQAGALITGAEDLLMRDGSSRAQAFDKLVAAAMARAVPLRLVAGEIVGGR